MWQRNRAPGPADTRRMFEYYIEVLARRTAAKGNGWTTATVGARHVRVISMRNPAIGPWNHRAWKWEQRSSRRAEQA